MMGKVDLHCDITLDELRKRWDYMTGEAFYAGCDEVMDLVFMGKRSGDKVSLIHKAPAMRNTFATVFYGELKADADGGSRIVGTFKKRKSDYIAAIVIAVLAFGFSQGIVDRQRYLALGIVCGALALVYLLCRVSKRSQKPLFDFLERISRGI